MEVVRLRPECLDLTVGSKITHCDNEYSIIGRLNMDTVLVRTHDGKLTSQLLVSDILSERSINRISKQKFAAIEIIDEDLWQAAIQKQEAIKRVFELGESSSKVAEELGMHVSSLYVHQKIYENFGIEGLVKKRPTGGAGKSRLDEFKENLLITAINDHYLTGQKKSIAKVYENLKNVCSLLSRSTPSSTPIVPPSRNTVYRRCHAIDQKEAMKKREGAKAAKDQFSQTMDGYQEATRPLEIVQIDHTLMDIIIVDAETRQPIGRPWLTIAIDVYSRMVLGFVISLDPPSAMSTALCLQQAICKKDKWLADRGVNHSWGIYGKPEALHMDNGKDFHSRTLRRGCDKHEIDMIYRPVGKPEYGAHVERLIGTFMEEMKVLPGATFSDIEEKGDYDSEKESAMTLAEVEKWFATLVTGKYHKSVHSTLMRSPEQKFLEGLQGNSKKPGAGINSIVVDEAALLMDFTPYFTKTVQNYGVRLDNIHYNCTELKKFINAIDPKTGKKRKFVVRRDPRDISVVYFFNPDTECYISVPHRKRSYPKMSLFELWIVLKRIKDSGKLDKVTEEEIFRTYQELKDIEEKAVKETKKARRSRARRAVHRLSGQMGKPVSQPREDVHIDEHDDDDVIPFEVEGSRD